MFRVEHQQLGYFVKHSVRARLPRAGADAMRFRVMFMERTNAAGDPSENADEYLEIETPDGVVLDKSFVERTKPAALHSEEVLEEDDSFLSVGSATWEYEVADDREEEFIDAIKNSQIAMEWQRLGDELSPVTPDEEA
jgi:hypothetical protein